MTFKNYVDSLVVKKNFYREIKEELGVSLITAERWCNGDYLPSKPEYLEGLSKITGIPVENLF